MSEPATNMCVAALAIGFENPDRVRQRLWNGIAVDMAGNRAIGRVAHQFISVLPKMAIPIASMMNAENRITQKMTNGDLRVFAAIIFW